MILKFVLSLVLLWCVSSVKCDYNCLCNYIVERPVYSQPDAQANPIGYLYEFDCKEIVPYEETPPDWSVVAFKHQYGYVEDDTAQHVARQLCPGNPPTSDVITTKAPTMTTSFSKASSTSHSTTAATTTKASKTTTSIPITTISTTISTTAVLSTKITPSLTTSSTTTSSTTTSSTTTPAPTSSKTTSSTTTSSTTTPPAPTTSTTTPSSTTPSTSTTTSSTTTPSTTTTTTTPTPTTSTTTSSTATTPAPTTSTTTTLSPTTTARASTTTLSTTLVTSSTPKPITGNTNLCPAKLHQYTREDGGALTQYGDYCYELVPIKTIWSKAERDCMAKGGDLFHVDGPGLQDYIYKWIKSFNFNQAVWTGLHDVRTEENFEWISGDRVIYLNWYSDRKGNLASHFNEDCVLLVPYAPYFGKWDDVICGSTTLFGDTGQQNPFICEYSIRPHHVATIVG